VALDLPARLQALIVDEDNISAVATVYLMLDSRQSMESIDLVLNGFLQALDGVTGGRIIDATVELKPTLSGGLKLTPEAGLSINQTGVFNFTAEGTSHLWGFAVPAISNHPDVTSGGTVVLTPTLPCAILVDYMLVVNSILANTNENSQNLEGLRDAFISFRKHTEPLARRSLGLA
jgi:hypothetical protein